MKLGLVRKSTPIARAVWLALPPHVRAPLAAAHPQHPEDTTLGEIDRALRGERTPR